MGRRGRGPPPGPPGSGRLWPIQFWPAQFWPANFGQSRPPGLHTTAREFLKCTFEGLGASNTTKIPREDPQEREKKNEHRAGDGKKRAIFLAVLRRGGSRGERCRLRPISTSANFWMLNLDHKGWGPEGWRPKPSKSRAPKVGAPKGGGSEWWGAQNFALFSPYPAPSRSFCLGMCTLGVHWLCVKPRSILDLVCGGGPNPEKVGPP